ncbi:MAG: WbqC family protein [Eubacteriales bacterium]|nr:WbqC family protein [Eubacteriales bacterium]
MIVSIHQPDYIPYIGYFYKIAQSDIYVFLDDAQFSNDNMHHWNKIKTPQGECRLKIPVEYRFGDSINQVRTKNELKWREKHLKTIEMNYSRAKCFKDVFPQFKEMVMEEYDSLASMNIAINRFICDGFSLKPQFFRTSEMDIYTAKEERVIDICLAVDGTTYLSGNGARAYQVDEHFSNRGVILQYISYHPFEYKQLWKEFIPNLSILDYLFNYGFDWNHIDEALRGS